MRVGGERVTVGPDGEINVGGETGGTVAIAATEVTIGGSIAARGTNDGGMIALRAANLGISSTGSADVSGAT